MAYTVQSAFDQFYDAINLGGDHREISNKRKDSLITYLGKSFTIVDSFAMGSIPKFTALKGHADLDIMVVLHYSKHIKNKSPEQVLKAVRDSLAEQKTNVRKNGQAVTLYYNSWPNVDVVPVCRNVNDAGEVTHYYVPNANTGEWIKSRPRLHARNIETKSSECGENFRKIIKMIKWWSLAHGDFLQSYHIEVLALKVFSGNLGDTPWQVFNFFKQARKLLESFLWYEGGNVDAYLGSTDRQEILKRFDIAISRAEKAWYYLHNQKTDHKTAIETWKQIFGERFPNYG